MRTIEIQSDQAFLDAAETVQAYVKYVLETEKTTAVLLTRVCPQTSLLEEDYVLSLNGEPCPLDLEFPIRIRGVWYEKETDQTPKYIVADPECICVNGREVFAFFDPAEFRDGAIRKMDVIPYEALYRAHSVPVRSVVEPVIANTLRVYDCGDGHTYEAVEPVNMLSDDISVVTVKLAGQHIPSESAKRWLICRYPAGKWDAVRRTLPAYPDAHWRKLPVNRLAQADDLELTGSEFKITRIGAK